jgi:curved DNA-binding protein CbpA
MFDFDPSKDYYKTLGVNEKATEKEIKEAYFKLAKKYHPDMNKGQTSDAFKEMTAAYDVLSDKEKKKQYDELRHSQNDSFSQSYYNKAKTNQYDPHNYGFNNKTTEDVFKKRTAEFRSKYTFRDPLTGKWKTYYSSSKGNPFFDDLNEFFKKMNKDSKQQGTKYNKYEDFKYNNEKGQYYDPYSQYKQNENFKQQDHHHQQDKNFYDYDFRYNPYEQYYRMYRNMTIMFAISILFFIFLAKRREYATLPPYYDPYVQYSSYPPDYVPIYNTPPPQRYGRPTFNDPYENPNPRVR